jgi:hypothetical protein
MMFPLKRKRSDSFARVERGGCGLNHNFMMIEIGIRTGSRRRMSMSQDMAALSVATTAGAAFR